MTTKLTALDEAFLELEELDGGALMNIGGILVFDSLPGGGTPTLEAVRASVAARLLPRYTARLSSPRTSRLSRLHWEPAEGFDVADHVRHAALPAPGNDEELCEWTGEFFSHPLDRSKPLWETVLLEGLEGGRWALASKVHHCLVDGVGSAGSMNLTLDHSPHPTTSEVIELRSDTDEEGRGGSAGAVRKAARAGARAGAAVVSEALLHPQEAFEYSRKVAAVLAREGLHGAPHTSLNVPIGQDRRYALVRVPISELKRIGHNFGASINDVVLAACTSGLRQLLIARDEQPPAHGLRAMVPVNVRDRSEAAAPGNQVSSLFVDLPVAEPLATVRLRSINAATRRLKASGAAKLPSALADLATFAPPVFARAALARTTFSTRLFNVTITNVPGPRSTLYAFGSPLREVHPIVPLAADHAVGVAIFSYDGRVTFGINADARSMHDLDVLRHGIEEGIDDLLRAVTRPPGSPRRPSDSPAL